VLRGSPAGKDFPAVWLFDVMFVGLKPAPHKACTRLTMQRPSRFTQRLSRMITRQLD
jgi:hypothetical protein